MAAKTMPQKKQVYHNPLESNLNRGGYTSLNKNQAGNSERGASPESQQKETSQGANFSPEFSLYNRMNHSEKYEVKQEIQKLLQEVKAITQDIKTRSASVNSEAEQIEHETMRALPENVGIYHIRFLELIREILQGIRLKLNDAGSWMNAMTSKKAKRGSAFAARSKKSGTAYSMSQELQVARNVN